MLDLAESLEENEVAIRTFVRGWFKLLAQGRLEEACALLDEPNHYGIVWTPQKILDLVHQTFSPETRFYRSHPEGPVFTDPDELEEQTDRKVGMCADATEYWLDYDVLLNHERSDLTAQFEFHKRSGGYAAILQDLHVL